MSYVISQNMSRETNTSSRIDYAALYEFIGNMVIEKAHAGDENCLQIYERSCRRLIKERNAGFLDNRISKPTETADYGYD
jgi:hypothetical protein